MSATLAYLAGLVDGEGYIGIKRTTPKNCIGIELSPDYCELAAKRTQQLSLEATA